MTTKAKQKLNRWRHKGESLKACARDLATCDRKDLREMAQGWLKRKAGR